MAEVQDHCCQNVPKSEPPLREFANYKCPYVSGLKGIPKAIQRNQSYTKQNSNNEVCAGEKAMKINYLVMKREYVFSSAQTQHVTVLSMDHILSRPHIRLSCENGDLLDAALRLEY